jgi:RHS repeat-associated protein
MIRSQGQTVVLDRLGSVRWRSNGERFNYFPYGEEYVTTGNGREKFGTYFRDSNTLDYADQRYYASQSGRFLTPDPSGVAHAEDPQSLNRYAYVGGDPISRFDSNGLDWEDPGGGCWWCFPVFPSIIIGGGGSFVPVLKPDPNWQTNGQVLKNVAAWDVLIAAALVANQTRQQDEPGFRYVAYLNVVDDCFVKQVGGGSAVRRRRYQAIDNVGDPYASSSLTISEHNYVQTGSLSAYNSPWHVNQNGMFDDFLSRGSGPDTVEYQQSNSSGLNSFINQPVMVRDVANPNGPFFGTLGITLRQHDVFINDSDGKLNGNPKYCNTPDL